MVHIFYQLVCKWLLCVAVQHLFPGMEFKPPNSAPGSDALQLSFGNVSSTMTTNSKPGRPYFMYNNARGEATHLNS